MSTCRALEDPRYTPAMRLIADITNAKQAVVTTAIYYDGSEAPVPFAHGYVTGTIVRLYVPDSCGMPEIDRKTSAITVLTDTTFRVDIDTRNLGTFTIPSDPSPHENTCSQVIPIGEINSILTAAVDNVS